MYLNINLLCFLQSTYQLKITIFNLKKKHYFIVFFFYFLLNPLFQYISTCDHEIVIEGR